MGHNEVRDEIFRFAFAIDGTTELEPLGLVSSRPALRPADVLTGVPDPSGRLAALDVGIIAPQAQGAGADCVETMVARKSNGEQTDSVRNWKNLVLSTACWRSVAMGDSIRNAIGFSVPWLRPMAAEEVRRQVSSCEGF